MPMLTTWVIDSSSRIRSANAAIWSSTACTCGTTSIPSTSIRSVTGARSATCITARSSVVLMCSPANMASRRASTPRSPGEVEQGARGSRVDRLLGVVDAEVADGRRRTDRHGPGRSANSRAQRFGAALSCAERATAGRARCRWRSSPPKLQRQSRRGRRVDEQQRAGPLQPAHRQARDRGASTARSTRPCRHRGSSITRERPAFTTRGVSVIRSRPLNAPITSTGRSLSITSWPGGHEAV